MSEQGWERAQVLEEGVRRKGEAVAAMQPVLDQTLADIQARLIFRAQAFIKVRLQQVPTCRLNIQLADL